ncbi:glycosyltransferase family 2 protein [Acidobacterium sp. S8]|uniref:glycosyltransferase family 2 protein n=1 Tax=Acidobacterium sp. S8 TaxID=1641854 RepID=UPI00131E95B5|nr:glycosyltransferase family 2 protein [Acidobacterium sp. S8]
MTNDVCALFITYRPEADVLGNIAKVRPQVQGLVVVDNGSSESARAPFHVASQKLDFTLIENGRNLGIAAALNIGVRWAQSQGYRWIVLFDQDSTITDGFIGAMLREYQSHPHSDCLAIVTPKHIDQTNGEWRAPAFAVDGTPLVAITSGSLMPLNIFEKCGEFEEDLIIDRVDDEYCLRARSLGFTIALCEQAILHHAVGAPRTHHAYGIASFRASHHNAKRRYYITRNRLVMVKRYWKQHPQWCYSALVAMLKDTAKVVLAEEDSFTKVINILRGTLHAITGRMGKVVEL